MVSSDSFLMTPQKVARFLGFVVAGLIVANVGGLVAKYQFGHGYLFGLVPLFDIDAEANIPSLFSTVLMLFCSALLVIISILERTKGCRHQLWLLLAIIFAFLAVDEQIGLHERIEKPLREALNTSGLLYFAWVIPYSLFLVIIASLYGRFMLRMPPKFRRLMILSAVIYVTGAIGFELIGGWYVDVHNDVVDLPYGILVTIEESLELIGLVTFIYALLLYISEFHYGVTIHIGGRVGASRGVTELERPGMGFRGSVKGKG